MEMEHMLIKLFISKMNKKKKKKGKRGYDYCCKALFTLKFLVLLHDNFSAH